ncbi:N-terminal acetyltransferase B complex catalytic subunit NAA20 [Linum grandiflorum]
MTTIKRFCCNDLLRFASVNLDHLTETFNMSFYMTYLARWPDYFHVADAPGNKVMGYIMGKVEGQGESWHGHVTAVTVATEYRRQQLAKKLMNLLEDISDKIDKGYFVDLFVRASNTPAIKMYEKVMVLTILAHFFLLVRMKTLRFVYEPSFSFRRARHRFQLPLRATEPPISCCVACLVITQ